MMFKKISFLFLALITVMINSHASLQHDMEHHYHHEHDSHEDHKNHADLEVEYNTENCEQCLLEHSIAESNHLQDSVKFIFKEYLCITKNLYVLLCLVPRYLQMMRW